jgi:hypothetical protein
MAGADPTGAFNATVFRTNIHNAMEMGLLGTVVDRPTFRWVVESTYAPYPTDPAGDPLDWSEPASVSGPSQITDMQVLCAVSYLGDNEEGTVAGLENAVKVSIVVLDTEKALLFAHAGRWPDQVLLAQAIYNVDYVAPSTGLFDVDVFTINATAVDQ